MIGKTLDQVVTTWNPATERLYGYTAREMIGQHIEILFPVEDRARETEIIEVVALGERVEQYQTRRLIAKLAEITSASH